MPQTKSLAERRAAEKPAGPKIYRATLRDDVPQAVVTVKTGQGLQRFQRGAELEFPGKPTEGVVEWMRAAGMQVYLRQVTEGGEKDLADVWPQLVEELERREITASKTLVLTEREARDLREIGIDLEEVGAPKPRRRSRPPRPETLTETPTESEE